MIPHPTVETLQVNFADEPKVLPESSRGGMFKVVMSEATHHNLKGLVTNKQKGERGRKP